MEEQPNNNSSTLIVEKNKNQTKKEQQKKQEEQQPVPFTSLFRFAQKTDYILMIVGSIASLAMGAALPAFALLWGQMTDSFGEGGDAMVNAARNVMYDFIYIGIGALIAGWLMFACWMIAGQRQAIQCRKEYLRSLLKQQIGWFDMINQSQLASKFATDSFAFQGAIGQKISTMLMTIGMFIAGFAVAFTTGWLMTLVVLSTIPALGFAGAIYITAISQKDAKSAKDYGKAGGKAQQALASIKTVKQLNGQNFQQIQYEYCLRDVASKALKYAIFSGIGIGSLFFVMLASYSLGFWYGSNCVEGNSSCPPSVSRQTYTAGDVLVVFFSILMAGFNLSQVTPAMKKIAQGRQAATRIFKIIDRQPLIKNPINGKKPQTFNGVIKFEGVTFAYPKDKSRKILNNINLQFNANSSALVGQSGCGKSTIFQLIMRFYDPDQGKITVDGNDLKELDLVWLKQKIGYVGQQPVLFATTIRENLLFGKQEATQEQINNALIQAEAYSFVQTLDQKLQTYVGYGGGQISGGQKQRIAIARALLRNPKILLLDEATSALDRKNERLIQKTLDKISQGRTSITIAHRAKTIMKSDVIYVLQKGKVQEVGKFKQLKRFKDVHFQQQDQIKQTQSPHKHGHQIVKKGRIDFINIQAQKGQQNKDKPETGQDIFLTKEEKQKKYQQQLLKKYEDNIFSRIMSYSSEKKLIFCLGIITAMINGLIFPTFTIFLSKMLNVLIKFDDDPVQARKDSNLYALIFLLLGILAFIINVVQMSLFSSIGEEITKRIRYQTYGKMLRMPITWYDHPRNNAGSLTARLSSDCNSVNGLTTTFIAITIQNITSLIAGITIGFVFQWRTSLVALGLIPFMVAAGAIQMAFTTGFSQKTDSAYKDSSNLIMQAMLNIRTVSSFGYENVVYHKYSQKLQEPLSIGIKKGNISGILFGFSQLVMFIIFALIFYIGTIFIRDAGASLTDVFTAIYAITFSAMTAGNNSHFLPDIGAAKNSAANLFQILDSQDEDQKQIRQQSKLLKTGISGHFQLKNIRFKYASRNNYVFENFNLQIKKGAKVAFVGHSGCGKSTIFQLLQRFYQPQEGQILIDGVNIKDYDIHYLRSCFGVVSQEPVLFDGSFKYNIIYNMKNVSEQEMILAAKQANALVFIEGEQKLQSELDPKQLKQLEDKKKEIQGQEHTSSSQEGTGFDKGVGIKGSHISGGQKQRVAIARAILRNPSILFLDQATSALDSANEKKVQQSLDRIMKGRTTLSIAHRIDTIKNSDQINVFDHGKVVQQGKYEQLVSKKGYFYNLERGTDFL